MKTTNTLKILLIIIVAVFGFFISDKPLLAQENPEDLQICNGAEGTVEDPAAQGCVVRDCDCNRIANNGKVGELICMEERTVRNDAGQIQYACKFPNSPTGVSCDTVGFTCPNASSNSGSVTQDSVQAETQDSVQSGVFCEEKLLEWAADKACDSQYDRFVSMDRWQSSAADPATGRCREFFLPNHVLENEKCGSSVELCAKGPVDQSCNTKVCLVDGAEACQETWRDENCNEITRVGKLTGNSCKTDTRIDITSAVAAAAQGNLSNDAQEFGINLVFGFRDQSTVHGEFRFKLDADHSGSTQPKTIWDIAYIIIDGTRFTLNPNNYHPDNFNLSRLDSDALVYILTTRVSETTYEVHPTVGFEFSDGSTRLGTLDILIKPNWRGTGGPKTLEQMVNTLTQVTIINPYTNEYFSVNRQEIIDFLKASFPGEIPNEQMDFYVKVPVQFRDGTELTSSATLTIKPDTSGRSNTLTIWDISGVEMNGWNFTLNPDNIQPNNFTFAENPKVIGEILNLQVPTTYTEVPITALVKFQDGTTRDAELKLVFEPVKVGINPPRTITDALSNIQELWVTDYYGTTYTFQSDLIREGIGRTIQLHVPYGETKVTLPISLTSVSGAYRSDNITIVYQPEVTTQAGTPSTQVQEDQLVQKCNFKTCDRDLGVYVCRDSWKKPDGTYYDLRGEVTTESCSGSGGSSTILNPVTPEDYLATAERICWVRGDTGRSCLDPAGFSSCLEKEAFDGNIFIGYKFKDDNTRRYFRMGGLSAIPAVNLLDLGKIFLGIDAWGQRISLYNDRVILLPKNVTTLPIILEDRRTNPSTLGKIYAGKVDYIPNGCP